MSANGLITLPSVRNVKETADRLAAEAAAKGLTIFARIDHAAGAKAVGLPLRPTELVIFGNAAGGTPLMQALQTTGIDLPLKALAWEDADGKFWLSYNDPAWIAARHEAGKGDAAAVAAVTARLAAALAGLAKAATAA
ncbi:MAG TPA: DUF302 domain-containing protein [Stellaceae bacterium]|nr:DUF302 domain-containing protein [Stellaceae bacterium]HTZ02778.1 DUF302 domain-containing protein [Xanthobacteraceae bacterium]